MNFPRRRRTPGAVSGAALALAGLLAIAPGTAFARSETLRWSYSEPDLVDGFEIHFGTASRSYDEVIDVGVPAMDATGAYSVDIDVPDDASVYVAVRAYASDGTSSPLSNEQLKSAPVAGPPQPAELIGIE